MAAAATSTSTTEYADPLGLSGTAISAETTAEWADAMKASGDTRALGSILPHVDAGDAVRTIGSYCGNPHMFSNKVSIEANITSQHSTGRCWMFAACNVARNAMIKRYGLPKSFELSPGYLFYWDKIERANFFLSTVWEHAGEGSDSRVIQHLMSTPADDGGQWNMLVAIIEKHGMMPKSCFPDLTHSKSSGTMNGMLKMKLREFSAKLVAAKADGASDDEAAGMISGMMGVVNRIVSSCFGPVPATVEFEYMPSGKGISAKLCSVTGASPLEFYTSMVKPVFDFSDYVSLVHDPRPEHPEGCVMTVACLGSVVGSKHAVRYINATIATLKRHVIDSVLDDEPVWFGCDVGKSLVRDRGVMSLSNYDFGGVFGACQCMSKEDRMRFKHSMMTHAMVITGIHIPSSATPMIELLAKSEAAAAAADDDEEDKAEPAPVTVDDVTAVSRYRVENSWGAKGEGAGYLSMEASWFDEYVYQIVVHKSRLSATDREALESATPIVLPPWDPLGALAE